MREREVGGYEPDDTEQKELHELWFMSRGAGDNIAELLAKHGTMRGVRIAWVVDAFLKKHDGEPNVKRKWIYVWCEAYLGHLVERTVTEIVQDRAAVVGSQTWMSCCTFHATGGPHSKMCQDKVWESPRSQRVSDVVPVRELQVCTNCQLPRLMHGTAMTDCDDFTTRKAKR